MREAGLKVVTDTVGNVIGRREGTLSRRTLVLGSHLDTVRDAGRFDGPLGVLLPIAALAELRRRGVRLPFAVEVVGFSEEEGVRFGSAYLGSKGFIGRLGRRDLALRDATKLSVADVLRRYNGGAFALPRARHRERDLIGYVEVHIEQGPVLESEKLSVGVVTGIAGQTRGRLRFVGRAGHAGTTPMSLRRDAFAAAAAFALAAEKLAGGSPPLLATVGTVTVSPGAPNVIPGEAVVSLDVRHPDDRRRQTALRMLLTQAQAIARQRKLTVEWQLTQDNGAVACSAELVGALDDSVRAVQRRSRMLVSGAGHDAVAMAAATSVAMLFVRCRGGVSHHPDEFASPRDIAVALRVMIHFLEKFGRAYRE